MRYTKRNVMAWGEANGVEILIDPRRPGGVWHVHANIDAPHKIFGLHGLHNLALWDSETAPDWDVILRDLRDAGLTDCTDVDCEWCNGDDAAVDMRTLIQTTLEGK